MATEYVVFWLEDPAKTDTGGRRPFIAKLAKTREEAAKLLGERPGWAAVVDADSRGAEVVDILGDAPTNLEKKELHRRVIAAWRELHNARNAARSEATTPSAPPRSVSTPTAPTPAAPTPAASTPVSMPDQAPRCAGHGCKALRGEARSNTPELYVDLCGDCRHRIRAIVRTFGITREAAKGYVLSGKRVERAGPTVASHPDATPQEAGQGLDVLDEKAARSTPEPVAAAPVIASPAPTAGLAPAEAVDRALRLAAALEAAGGVRGVEEATEALARCGGAAAAIEANQTLARCGGGEKVVEAVTLVADLGGAALARELAAFAASVGGAKTLIDVVRVVMEAAGA